VTSNQGKYTAGVDGITLKTPEQKWQQAQVLNPRRYQPLPLRRIYIPKKSGKKRALGIPAQRDRAEQALDLPALDPVSETLADSCSYGFRKERSPQDAMARCFLALAKRNSAEWILAGDIRACFDEFDHEWLVEHTPNHEGRLRAWLQSGYMEQRRLGARPVVNSATHWVLRNTQTTRTRVRRLFNITTRLVAWTARRLP
jgi:RNA-directed DNA polymerase